MKNLFLDLDGVVADFERGIEAIFGENPFKTKKFSAATTWRIIYKQDDFFANLPLMDDARYLLDAIYALEAKEMVRLSILTGIPRGNWAVDQKKRWVAENLRLDIPVITCQSAAKPTYAGDENDILIDDRDDLIAGWRENGGTGIHHINARTTVEHLLSLF